MTDQPWQWVPSAQSPPLPPSLCQSTPPPVPGHLLCPPPPRPGCTTRAPLPLPPPAPRCRRRYPPSGEVLLDAQKPLPQRLQHLPGLPWLRRPAPEGGARAGLGCAPASGATSPQPAPSLPPLSTPCAVSPSWERGGLLGGAEPLVLRPALCEGRTAFKARVVSRIDLEQRVDP